MAKDTNTVRVLERAIRERRPFVFIADLGGGKISVSGPCGKEWLDEVLTAFWRVCAIRLPIPWKGRT